MAIGNWLAGAVLTVGAALAAANTEVDAGPIVRIDSGRLQGAMHEEVASFKGIPYAAPPTGALRWRPPQPPRSWDGIRAAGTYGHICMQPIRKDNGVGTETPSEDCLTLNVWTPAPRPAANLPVMVWIHGGGFVEGSGSAALYDGTNLAQQGVVLVTINYRLGRLGFFAHPALSRDAEDEPLANYGFMDIVAALSWVQRNIAAFGGDVDNITIFGESAGGAAVNLAMISPAARGLFHRAIAQSGAGRGTPRLLRDTNARGLASAEADGAAFARTLGVAGDDPAALRAIPAETIIAAGDVSAFKGGGPVIDGRLIPMRVSEAFEQGMEARIPYIVGYNSVEVPSTPESFDANLEATSPLGPAERERIAAAYPDEATFVRNAVGDIVFAEPARYLAARHAAHGARAYLYRFSVLSKAMRSVLPGTPHAQERQYIFRNLDASPWPTDPADEVQAALASAYWVDFATTGDPNGDGRPVWPAFSKGNERLLDFTNDGPVAKDVPHAERLDAIAEHYVRSVDDSRSGE